MLGVACPTAPGRESRPGEQPAIHGSRPHVAHVPPGSARRDRGFRHCPDAGDMEFLGRLRARFGGLVLARLDLPLVIATSSPWTNSKRFPREALDRYREGFAAWHLRNGRSEKLFVPLGERAPFVAPAELL